METHDRLAGFAQLLHFAQNLLEANMLPPGLSTRSTTAFTAVS